MSKNTGVVSRNTCKLSRDSLYYPYREGVKTMNTYRIIERLSSASRTTKASIAQELGLTPQGLHHALRHNITFEQMSKAVEKCGYILLIGKMVDGKPQEIKTVKYYEKD